MGQPLLIKTYDKDYKSFIERFELVDKATDALLLRQHIMRRAIKIEDAARYLRADYDRLSSLFMGDLTAIDHSKIKEYLLAIKEAIEHGIPIE